LETGGSTFHLPISESRERAEMVRVVLGFRLSALPLLVVISGMVTVRSDCTDERQASR